MRQLMKCYFAVLVTVMSIHDRKHTIDDANMKMHVSIEARTKAVNESADAKLHSLMIEYQRTEAMRLQAD